MEQKKFMDIERIKESSDFMAANTNGFEVGDHILIQVKFDGSNASFRYDRESGELVAFSRNRELSEENGLSGFYDYVKSLDVQKFEEYPNYVFFGEWAVKNKIVYKPEYRKVWIMYDVFDVEKKMYLPQAKVKELAEKFGFMYIHVLYEGPFVSWEHCRSFMDQVIYSETTEEGIVVKNQTKLNLESTREPFVLKIVSDKFSEVMKTRVKKDKTEVDSEKAAANELVASIVTRSRVEKELYKMRDEGLISEVIGTEDMKVISKQLPTRIYRDCVKEEEESVKAAGKYFGKVCGYLTMKFARSIVLGQE